MLTPTDIHFLVGLLSRMSHPDAVEVELGSMVWDEASESNRDVDVTISMKAPDGGISVFSGIEVKAHNRKLGTEAVEQLAQKLKDMPAVTKRAIVSASGFTKPSIRKARKHGIELLELKDWPRSQFFPNFSHEPSPNICVVHRCASIDSIEFIPSDPSPDSGSRLLNDDELVFFGQEEAQTREPIPLKMWVGQLSTWASKELESRTAPIQGNSVFRQLASVTVRFSDFVWVNSGNRRIALKEVLFKGVFEKISKTVPSVLKALVPLDASIPISGCCVSEFEGFGLFALMFHNSGVVECAAIPVSDRNKEKILRHRITAARPFDSK